MSKQFDWMEHLGFKVIDDGVGIYIYEDGDQREADMCHRVLWNEMTTFKAERDGLLAALEEVFSIGDRLVSDVYGGEFVNATRALMSSIKEQS